MFEMLERRRSRERVARALEMGPPVMLQPIGMAPPRVPSQPGRDAAPPSDPGASTTPAAVAPPAAVATEPPKVDERESERRLSVEAPRESRLSMGMDVSPPSRIVPTDEPPPESDDGGIPGYVWIVLIVVVLIGVVIWQTQH